MLLQQNICRYRYLIIAITRYIYLIVLVSRYKKSCYILQRKNYEV